MPMTEAIDALARTNQVLIDKVAALDAHLTLAEDAGVAIAEAAGDAKDAADRSRFLTKVAVGISVLALASTGLAFWSLRVNCANANESRAGNLAIWQVVLNANKAQQPPKQRAQAKVFDAYVRDVYAPHDCGRPWKSYSIPPAPTL